MRHNNLLLTLFLLAMMFPAASRATDARAAAAYVPYELGQGWQVGDYYFSGYTNIEIVSPPTQLNLDDLSLFAGGRVNQWVNPFTEVELTGQTLIPQNNGHTNGDYLVERFYNDALLNEHDTLRVGKTLTPLGDWNLRHAAPLNPTNTRPSTTALGFHAYTSGISWLHDPEDGQSPDFQLYWQPGKEWFKRPDTVTSSRNYSNVFGGHINLQLDIKDKIGASFQHGHLIEAGETFTVYGINANKSFGRLRLEGEALTSHFSGAPARLHDTESGIFGLADYSVTHQWHGILEWERYQDHMVSAPSRNTLVGINYRPVTPMVWKLEYTYQMGEPTSFNPVITGWQAAFSLIF